MGEPEVCAPPPIQLTLPPPPPPPLAPTPPGPLLLAASPPMSPRGDEGKAWESAEGVPTTWGEGGGG